MYTVIRARLPQAVVEEVAAPALVPLVEAGVLAGPIARSAVAAACARFTPELDALVLACTHYPLLDPVFAAVLGANVSRIDPALAQSERAVAFAAARGAARGESGRTRYVTTGPLEPFREALRALAGPPGPGDEIFGRFARSRPRRLEGRILHRSTVYNRWKQRKKTSTEAAPRSVPARTCSSVCAPR